MKRRDRAAAQYCQTINAHSSRAMGNAITRPRPNPRLPRERTGPASKAVSGRFKVSAKSIISTSLLLLSSMPYLRDNRMTTRSRPAGPCVSRKAVAPRLQGEAGVAGTSRSGRGPRHFPIEPTTKLARVLAALDHHSPLRPSHRGEPTPEQDQNSRQHRCETLKIGDRKC